MPGASNAPARTHIHIRCTVIVRHCQAARLPPPSSPLGLPSIARGRGTRAPPPRHRCIDVEATCEPGRKARSSHARQSPESPLLFLSSTSDASRLLLKAASQHNAAHRAASSPHRTTAAAARLGCVARAPSASPTPDGAFRKPATKFGTHLSVGGVGGGVGALTSPASGRNDMLFSRRGWGAVGRAVGVERPL